MPFKMSEERRAYHREYLRKKYAADPEYREKIKALTRARNKAGYFKEHQKTRRAEGGEELRKKEAALMKARRIANPEKYREISNRSKAKARKERPHLHRGQWLKWSYGMSLEEYQQRLLTQEGKCAFCPTEHTEEKPLVVDHDHDKPKGEGNRWLLCNSCNVMIGAAKESPEILRKAAELLGAYFGTGYRCRLPVAQPHPLAGHGRPLSL